MLKRILTPLVALVAALPAAAFASILQFNVLLNAANEVSPPLGWTPNLAASGLGTLFYDTVANSYDFTLTATGLSSTVTGAHIHAQATTLQNSPVRVALDALPFTNLTPNPSTLVIFGFDIAAPVGLIPAGNGHPAQSFLSVLQAGLAYVNIHTSLRPSGEIRGQLVQVVAVPEPETYALLAAGLVVVGFAARRRRQSL